MIYDHITDPAVRSLLEGDVSEDLLCQALTNTRSHLAADIQNPEIGFGVLNKRINAYNNAHTAWNQEGDMPAAVEALRDYWV